MKWAIREAVDVYFKAKTQYKLGSKTFRAGEPMLIFDSVQTATYEIASEVSYVTGGRGNARLLSFEGDKTLTFTFTEALLSNEGLAILSGADLISARNPKLPGASPDAKMVIAHNTEKYSVTTLNQQDLRQSNVYANDASLVPPAGSTADYSPRGGKLNVWMSDKPYVGQNSDLYVMLLDDAGEVAGLPIQINLNTYGSKGLKVGGVEVDETPDYNPTTGAGTIMPDTFVYLAKFKSGDFFVAFDSSGLPMPLDPGAYQDANKNLTRSNNIYVELDGTSSADEYAVFDDQVAHYVYSGSTNAKPDWWLASYGEFNDYVREITAPNYTTDGVGYSYLLAPSGGVAQPCAFKEGGEIVYKANVPSILYQDIVLIDMYKEYKHDATQISILPDKFAPYVYVEGSSLLRRASDGMDIPVEFVIPKFKVTTALTFTLTSTGDASTFDFAGDAYPDFSKFDLTRKVLADILVLDADDNYDGAAGSGAAADPTSYRRFKYNSDTDGEYIWKDPSMEPHQNLDFSDTGSYTSTDGGPASITPGSGLIDEEQTNA